MLIVGEVPGSLRAELVDRGAVIWEVDTLAEAFAALAADAYDVVLLNADTDGCGLDFVNALKEGATEHERTIATLYGARGGAAFLRGIRPPEQGALERLRERYGATPFVLMPQGGSFYAVIVKPPAATAWLNLEKVPIATTVMTIEASTLLGKSGPLA